MDNRKVIYLDDAIDLLEELETKRLQGDVGLLYAPMIKGLKKLPSAEPVRCKDCRWGREVCGNIECFVDSNIPTEYHGYEWFCPNGERRTDE